MVMDWIPVALRCPNEEEAKQALWLYDAESRRVIPGRYMISDVDEPVDDGYWLDPDGKEIVGDIDFWMIATDGEPPLAPR
jgi:hypothetical protein